MLVFARSRFVAFKILLHASSDQKGKRGITAISDLSVALPPGCAFVLIILVNFIQAKGGRPCVRSTS